MALVEEQFDGGLSDVLGHVSPGATSKATG